MSDLKIEVFGARCAKCRKIQELFMRAASEMGVAVSMVNTSLPGRRGLRSSRRATGKREKLSSR